MSTRNLMPDITNFNPETDPQWLFVVRTASHWLNEAQTRPIPRKLFGEFWFEGELCFLFADTNVGKSILAVQIADSISRGSAVQGFALEAAKQRVLYLDFELTEKQFEGRYSNDYQAHYPFDDCFLRAEVNSSYDLPVESCEFDRFLIASIECLIIQSTAKVVIIDNLTFLRNSVERATGALLLMKHLKALKRKYGLSVLVLAHTPKRDQSRPLTRNDLQGSKMLINFCDSAFAIGESRQDKTLRYLKQMKARNTDVIHDAENVCVCKVEKRQNFLHFEMIGCGVERDHLTELTEKNRLERLERVKELAEQGMTQREIAAGMNLSLGAINKYLRQLRR